MEQPRMQQTMPEDRSGWHEIDAGPHLEVQHGPLNDALSAEASPPYPELRQ